MNIEFKRKMPTPQALKDMYPISDELVAVKRANDKEIQAVFSGEDDRLVLIIGPLLRRPRGRGDRLHLAPARLAGEGQG